MSDLLTTAEAASRLGVSPSRILALIRADRLPARKAGRDWLIRADDLAALVRKPVGRPRRGEER